jgi:hypothetical protein
MPENLLGSISGYLFFVSAASTRQRRHRIQKVFRASIGCDAQGRGSCSTIVVQAINKLRYSPSAMRLIQAAEQNN